MKNKIAKPFLSILIAVTLIALTLLSGCEENLFPSWELSDGNKKVTASLSDNGNGGFILTIEGNGTVPNYPAATDTPWYGKADNITDIIIKNGVTSIGNNAFSCCKVRHAILPDSVTSIGNNCFYEQTLVCAYGNIAVADGATVYKYSETQPLIRGNYWHYSGDTISVWEVKTTKVLFIGNSFTYYSNVPSLFENLAKSVGAEVIVESVTKGGWTLTKFADETDKYGKMVDDKLKADNDYDVVILQDQSTRPLDNYDAFLAAVKKLNDKIRTTQTNCRIVLYSTWGYKKAAESREMTIPQMEAALRAAYDNAAREIDARVSYVGAAFTKVYNEHLDVNENYYLTPENYENSPEKGFALYVKKDNKHQSYSGAYLSACVHLATIFGVDPKTSAFNGELDEATATELKNVAYSVVFG